MAKMFQLCAVLFALLIASLLPAMAEDATPPGEEPAVMPDDKPAPAPAPAKGDAEPEFDLSTDSGKFQKAVMLESKGMINQALILYLQATAGNDASGYNADLAAQAAYKAGDLFATHKNDPTRAAKLFHFSFAVGRYSDAALRAGDAYRAAGQIALACKMYLWGMRESTDENVKGRCNTAFTEGYAQFDKKSK